MACMSSLLSGNRKSVLLNNGYIIAYITVTVSSWRDFEKMWNSFAIIALLLRLPVVG
jgi:hypothetical protein